MTKKLSSAERVEQALNDLGVSSRVKELPRSTRTAQEAARAVGCQVDQIVKSLVFTTRGSNRPILIMTSGANQVDEEAVSGIIGEKIQFASPSFVREKTGFAIGGVSPVGHTRDITTYIDRDLLAFSTIWAAAGTPHAVFQVTPDELVQITGGQVIAVS